MVRSPGNECPVRPMPESAHEKDDKRVPYHLRLTHPAATQRYVHIVAEPCRQRYVPPPPKLGYVSAEIRHVEVPHQLYPEQFGGSNGNVAVPREVTVDLESEEYGRKEKVAPALLRIRREYLIHEHRAVVCNHYLLEQTPQYLAHPVYRRGVIKLPLLQELRQKVGRTLDGAGN